MAKPKKFPAQRTLRLSTETDNWLIEKGKIMGVGPAEVGRIYLEHAQKGDPIPEKKEKTDAE